MRSILLVKTSSLGDVVHNLPVVNDIRRALGDYAIDWVVERTFAPIPGLHPSVRAVIPCELRRWRRSWYSEETRRRWRSFTEALRANRYDAVIDTQGLLKSAVIARVANGPRFGLDWRSSREPLGLFYDRTFPVPWSLHAVERNRLLCSMALGYKLQGEPDFGIHCERANCRWLPSSHFLVLVHSTSHPRKLWPEAQWIEFGRTASESGFGLVLPWGTERERERALRLALRVPGAVVPDRLELTELAAVLVSAAGVLGVDTGLTHFAAALGVPTVGIYGATDPHATGVYGSGLATNLGTRGRFPSAREAAQALTRLGVCVLEQPPRPLS